MPTVGIILGSDSDLPKIRDCFSILDECGVPFEVNVSSAHRTPDRTHEWAISAQDRGIKVIIAVAGGAAHLPGVVAAYTALPVIGVPIETKISGGLDSILSILQMPAGIPVATMPAGSAGGANAALMAVRILALGDSAISKNLERYRDKMRQKVIEKNDRLQSQGLENFMKGMEQK